MLRPRLLLTFCVLAAGAAVLAGCGDTGEKRHLAKIEGNTPQDRQATKLLVDLLANDPQVRTAAANQLGDMKYRHEAVRDALADRLKLDAVAGVRMACAKALQKLGDEDSFGELQEGSAAGIIEAREVYLEVTRDLRQKSMQGDRAARATLMNLGEKYIDQPATQPRT